MFKHLVPLFALFCAVTTAPFAQAQGADFYQGKQITAIVSYDPGTDYDIWMRLIARYMGGHLPGHPAMIVQDMPGGGGITAANHLYNLAERDGTVFGMLGRNLPFDGLTRQQGVRFDATKYNWIGSPELATRVCAAIAGARVKKAEDLFQNELIVGGNGAGSATSTTPVLVSKVLGMKFKLVEGYPSPADVFLAMDRGELEGICVSLLALRQAHDDWIKSGKLKILFNTERQPVPGLGAPSVFSFAKTDEQRRILELFASSVELGRPIVAPPGVPAERVALLRQAFAETMNDPGLLADAKQQGLDVHLITGESLASLIDDLMSTPSEFVDRLNADLK